MLPNFDDPDWTQFHVLASRTDPKYGVSSSTQIGAVKRLYDKVGFTSTKKLIAGGMPDQCMRRRMAHLTRAPMQRNKVSPSVELQCLIFPWIEKAYGKPGTESWKFWQRECEDEMAEVDENEVKAVERMSIPLEEEAIASSGKRKKKKAEATVGQQRGNKVALPNTEIPDSLEPVDEQEQQQEKEPASASATDTRCMYSTKDVYKRLFLKLLVRCRRIISQDAAALFKDHMNPGVPIAAHYPPHPQQQLSVQPYIQPSFQSPLQLPPHPLYYQPATYSYPYQMPIPGSSSSYLRPSLSSRNSIRSYFMVEPKSRKPRTRERKSAMPTTFGATAEAATKKATSTPATKPTAPLSTGLTVKGETE
ncbi:hypothetical protein BCR41DRAFT_397538 [Lobosporangium transversale]|uniref:Uncharacterized protein n=1 Tax=Lobosporangium transversale TaxID=64571 RepID=A0A1Y2GJ81_9FUNG|nr:hypothetical protein BCR41DRAFT_397538 [Lobosporangium transversale]ORZ12520.1 hypothetical protein BCR41DRAFT_397538 [Lobosporangium transversale]|eukprot:XP_021880139.1 hypothetical protein BCR41DRAFT_397538 [Lobosporangium transversale]